MAAVREAVVRRMHNLDHRQLSEGGHKYVVEIMGRRLSYTSRRICRIRHVQEYAGRR